MPVVALLPSADGAYGGWSLGAGASRWTALQSDDDHSTFLRTGDGTAGASEGETMSYVVGNKPSSISVVNSMKVRSRGYTPEDRISGHGMYAAFGATLSGIVGTTLSSGSWVTTGPSTVGRPGGGTWGPSDISNSTLGVAITGGNVATWETTQDCTSLWLVLDYSPPGGAFVRQLLRKIHEKFHNIQLCEMPAIAHIVWAETRELILPHEYVQAWRELREDRNRVIYV